MNLTEKQAKFAIRCFAEWTNIISSEDNKDYEHVSPQMSCDILHSSLLYRLLSGKDPLPNPPPKRHGYPDYALAEGKRVQVMSVIKHDGRVLIDGSIDWDWIHFDDGLLRHLPSGETYRLSGEKADDPWRPSAMGEGIVFLQKT